MKHGRSPKKRFPKATPLAGRTPLSAPVAEEFADFVEYHSAEQFRRNLRKMLLDFLMQERSVEYIYLKDLLYDLGGLFDLLDVIASKQVPEEDEEESALRQKRKAVH